MTSRNALTAAAYLGPPGVHQVGSCVLAPALGGGTEARCLLCDWWGLSHYEYEIARKVAEHSRTHNYEEPKTDG